MWPIRYGLNFVWGQTFYMRGLHWGSSPPRRYVTRYTNNCLDIFKQYTHRLVR